MGYHTLVQMHIIQCAQLCISHTGKIGFQNRDLMIILLGIPMTNKTIVFTSLPSIYTFTYSISPHPQAKNNKTLNDAGC